MQRSLWTAVAVGVAAAASGEENARDDEVVLRPWGLKVLLGLLLLSAGFFSLFELFEVFLWRNLLLTLWLMALGTWSFSGGIIIKLDNDEALRSPESVAVLAKQRQRPKSLLDRWWVWVVALMAVCIIGGWLDVKTGTRQTNAPAQAEAIEIESATEKDIETESACTYKSVDDEINLYIVNTSSGVFHRTDCPRTAQISEKNRELYNASHNSAVQGYTPCSVCNP